ncbi:MAG: hypothetical protein HZB14_01075 [Actinobacteria bacterium]|nr:hypothetical protein [Actinomycetota bacterium]
MVAFRLAAQRTAIAAATAVMLLLCASLIWAAGARAASVAYIDGYEVWVSTTDGVYKLRLSSGEGDWRAVAQSDQGYIVGVRLESGKIANLSSFTVWDPAGKVIHFGPLAGNSNGSNAYPLSLDLTPDGGLIVYGYSRLVYGFPLSTLYQGHYLLPSATRSAPVPEPYSNSSARWPTLVGERVVGTPDEQYVAVQDTGGTGSTTFNNWFDYIAGGYTVHRTDVAATGTVTASELELGDAKKIALGKYQSLGGAYIDDCFLDADAAATQPSISQDATEFAWQDSGGVKVAGVPSFGGPAVCALTHPPVTISPSGSDPSIGPFNVPVAISSPAFKPQLPGAPSSFKITKLLKKGVTVKVTSRNGGKATLKLSVKPKAVGKRGKKAIVIATGAGDVPAGDVGSQIKLKMNRKGKSLKKKLKGKRATLTVTIDGQATTKTIKLK